MEETAPKTEAFTVKRQDSPGARSLKARKSVASVFLAANLSVTKRLGIHLQVDKYTSEGLIVILDEDQKKKALRKKKAQECKLFCCDTKNKQCLGKGGFTWIRVFLLLFIFWAFLVGLMWIFYMVFVAIDGGEPDLNKAFKDRAPILTDSEALKKNVEKGWSGETLSFPYLFGSQMFIPGINPLTLDIWENEENETKKKLHDEWLAQKTSVMVFTFPTDKHGMPKKDWIATWEAAYADYFASNYKTPASELTGCSGKFQSLDEETSNCTWPMSPQTSAKNLISYRCEGNETGTPEVNCFPILYFTVNNLIGWVPQKTDVSEEFAGIHCEIDKDDILNEGISQSEFDGTGGENCKPTGHITAPIDLCGYRMARFPYTGLKGIKTPIIRYDVTKMPRNKDIMIRCRLDYPGYDKQIGRLVYPFSQRKDRAWTQLNLKTSGASTCLARANVLLTSYTFSLLLHSYHHI